MIIVTHNPGIALIGDRIIKMNSGKVVEEIINKKRIKDLKTTDEYFDFMKIEEEDRDRLLKDYSHGMKNKMQMLVNIIASPNVLLLDEPLTSFDVVVAEEMKQMLKEIKKDHIIIFSTHIMELALDLCDDIVILNKGLLEEIDKNNLDNEHLKNKIIRMYLSLHL